MNEKKHPTSVLHGVLNFFLLNEFHWYCFLMVVVGQMLAVQRPRLKLCFQLFYGDVFVLHAAPSDASGAFFFLTCSYDALHFTQRFVIQPQTTSPSLLCKSCKRFSVLTSRCHLPALLSNSCFTSLSDKQTSGVSKAAHLTTVIYLSLLRPELYKIL